MRYGRHFWPRKGVHIVVGRDAEDNEILSSFTNNRWTFWPAETKKGPLVLAEGLETEKDIQIAAAITARYTSEKKEGKVCIRYDKAGTKKTISSVPIEEEELVSWRV